MSSNKKSEKNGVSKFERTSELIHNETYHYRILDDIKDVHILSPANELKKYWEKNPAVTLECVYAWMSERNLPQYRKVVKFRSISLLFTNIALVFVVITFTCYT